MSARRHTVSYTVLNRLEAAEWDRHRKNPPKDHSWGIMLGH